MVVKLNRETKLTNFETSKNSKPVWDKCRLYFSNKHVHGDSKIVLIAKKSNGWIM